MKRNLSEKAVLEESIGGSPIEPTNLAEQVRLRAYQIYEQNGMQDGFAEQDWKQAEAEILQTKNVFKTAA